MDFYLFKEFLVSLIEYTPTSLLLYFFCFQYFWCFYIVSCVVLRQQEATSVHVWGHHSSLDQFFHSLRDRTLFLNRPRPNCTVEFVFLFQSVELGIFYSLIRFTIVPNADPWCLCFQRFFQMFQSPELFDLLLN